MNAAVGIQEEQEKDSATREEESVDDQCQRSREAATDNGVTFYGIKCNANLNSNLHFVRKKLKICAYDFNCSCFKNKKIVLHHLTLEGSLMKPHYAYAIETRLTCLHDGRILFKDDILKFFFFLNSFHIEH